MIRVIAAAIVAIFAIGIALAQEDRSPAQPALYVIADSSGSMARGANWGDVVSYIASQVRPLLETTDVSLNQVGGDDRNCLTPVDIRPAERLTEIELSPPSAAASTLIGKGLQEVVETIGRSPAKILIITDGSEQCTPTLCDVAASVLAGRDQIRVELLFTEDALPSDKVRLSCVAEAQKLAIESNLVEPYPASSMERLQPSIPPEPAIDALRSLPWIGLMVMFAVSFFIFGRTFSKSHKELEAKFKTVEKDVQENQTELENPRFFWSGFLFVLAAIGALILLFFPNDLFDEFRSQVAITLNTEFGAALFLAGLLMLAGFGGSQYWKYAELRREYSVATEAEAREKARVKRERVERAERRLFESYQRQRTVLADRAYPLHRYLTSGELTDENTALLNTIVDLLKFLALGDELSQGKIDKKEVERLAQFNAFLSDRTLFGLIDKISEDRLPTDLRSSIRVALAPEVARSPSEQHEKLSGLIKRLKAHVATMTTDNQS